jgi:Protein of unknown function (DUF742)
MASTPSGGYPYGHGYQPEPEGDAQVKRFNFPSAPSRRARTQQPGQQPPRPYRGAQAGPAGPPAPGAQQQPYDPGYPPMPGHVQRGPYESPYEPYEPPSPPRIVPVQPSPRPAPEPTAASSDHPLVRPYAMTGGRTRPRYQLAIEALVSTTADPSQLRGLLPEHERICHLCLEIKSIAEISALLTIPLGVARILVADLAEAGLVAIHQPGGDEAAGGQPDVTLLERVLSGLRKL